MTAADADSLRETVRERYAAAALATTDPTAAAGCCGTDTAVITDEQAELFGAGLYGGERDELPDTALLASLGCGNPTAMADLHQARRCSTSGPAVASTCCSPPAAWARPAPRTGST